MRIECSYSELCLVSSLKEHPNNRNIHNERQITALAKIIAKVGQRSPIVISKRSGFIVKGHGRKKALELLGWEKCAVDYQNYESELEELNDRVADNEIARYSEFNQAGFLSDLAELKLDLPSIDFNEFGMLDFTFSKGQDQKVDNINISSEDDEWVGMPEFNPKDKNPRLIISFENKEYREEFIEKHKIPINKKGDTLAWNSTYPFKEMDDLKSVKYE